MVEARFMSVAGARVFAVGGAKAKVYSTKPGQREVYRNGSVSLHVIPPAAGDEWTSCRLYLIGGKRRKVWHLGVNVSNRRTARTADVQHLKGERPEMLSWVVDFVCGNRREAPPLDAGDAPARKPTLEEINLAIDCIEWANYDGVSWSFAPNTRARGRYVVDNLCAQMPDTPVRVVEDIVRTLALNDVIQSRMVDSRMKRYGLVVDRTKIKAMMEKIDV